jgi:regulator of ribonuclease activity A
MELRTCDLCDTHGEQVRVLSSALRHFGGRRRFRGAIVTVSCFEDNSRVKELVAATGHGRVLLIAGGGSTACALLGDMLGTSAYEHGWAGLVVDGAVRDTATLSTLDLGVMALASSPRRSRKNGEGEVGGTVEIAGVRCAPGDVLVADEDGAVLVAPSLLGEV